MSEWTWERIERERLRAEMCAEARFTGEDLRSLLDFVMTEDTVLRTRIAELEAELKTEREAYREWYGKAGDDGAPATWDQLKRTATEAALRYAWSGTVHGSQVETYVTRGLKALLGETTNDE